MIRQVYNGNILQSLNIKIFHSPVGKRSPCEKGFLLGLGNNQQIGAWIIFGGSMSNLKKICFMVIKGWKRIGPLTVTYIWQVCLKWD